MNSLTDLPQILIGSSVDPREYSWFPWLVLYNYIEVYLKKIYFKPFIKFLKLDLIRKLSMQIQRFETIFVIFHIFYNSQRIHICLCYTSLGTKNIKVNLLNWEFLNQARTFPWFFQVPQSKFGKNWSRGFPSYDRTINEQSNREYNFIYIDTLT